ncbi:MAG: hypothetical protein IKP73_12175 [Bacteroidales bacterium]|nr:hypothetical protein [Bacteroidales bacterium]
MARTVDEIKTTMEESWMSSDALKALYKWELDEDGRPPEFSETYSKASLENILLYIVAYCAYVIERLMDTVKAEIEDEISTKVPGSLQWYVRKMKEFVYMPALSEDDRGKVVFNGNTGEYTIDPELSESALNKARIVRHAVAIDNNVDGILQLKVAGEDASHNLIPLTDQQKEAFLSYIMRVKYAGVRIKLITAHGDKFNCTMTVWYDPLYTAEDVRYNCEKAISDYIKGLPFNGEYTNMALIDSIQAVKGVKVAELSPNGASYTLRQNGRTQTISAKVRPFAGYFNIGKLTLKMECYE